MENSIFICFFVINIKLYSSKVLKKYKIVVINLTYPITKQFIKDGKKNKILKKFLNSFDLPVFLFHGNKDKSVPIKYSRKTLKLFKSDNKKLFVIKNGDHSLSRKKDLKMIQKNLRKLVNLQI